MKLTVVFVHGWSVTNLDTYGELPLRLREEGKINGLDIQVEEIFLGRYISFNDAVKVPDISRAFRTAVKEQIRAGVRFVCITHSTGGPVIRDWWKRYYESNTQEICPMSHAIMLAPANFGSALAQLGKGKISRLKSWAEGVEPGQGVLDWLELGSAEAWNLNTDWILGNGSGIGENGIFPFALTGEYIDRKFYDNLNSYTGELGSDGVVRAASANLNGRYMRLSQNNPQSGDLTIAEYKEAPKTPFRIITGKSHSGDEMGILKSVKRSPSDAKSAETVSAIIRCIKVKTRADYDNLYNTFATETEAVQRNEFIEVADKWLGHRVFLHDRYSMLIFRVRDHEGYPVTDFDLLLLGKGNNANTLPEGFFGDRQRNHLNPETITYFVNYDIMNGVEEAKDPKNDKTVRPAIQGTDILGIQINPRPDSKDSFVRYRSCSITASKELCDWLLNPNGTTLIDIRLQRIVSTEVARLVPVTTDQMPTKTEGNFKGQKPGPNIVE